MKYRFGVLFLLMSLLFSSHVYGDEMVETSQVKNILILHSYHRGLSWTDQMEQGIESAITSEDVELYIEYLDSYRMEDPNGDETLYKYIKSRYEKISIDILVVADNYAYNFLKAYYDELFEGIPVIFGGINNFDKSLMFTESSSGVAQTSNYAETIELIMQLHPKTKRIVAIGANNATALAETKKIVEVGNALAPDILFEQMISENLEEQIATLKIDAEDTAVVIAGTIKNRLGTFYDHAQYANAIIEATGHPVYAMANVYVESGGAIGGFVVNANDQGKLMGEYVQALLSGASVEDLPVIEKPSSVYDFNYGRLKAFGINQRELPKNSIILEGPETMVQIGRDWFLLYVLISIVFVILSVVLAISYKRRKNIELELNNQNGILTHMAFHDSTTNLYNRKYMVDYIQRRLVDINHPVTALYDVDVVNLKTITDTFGHDIGNELLRQVGKILRREFDSSKECVGIDYSEFLVVDSTVTNREEAVLRVNEMIKVINKPVYIEQMEIDVKVNIGISMAPEHSMDPVLLLKKANIALVESIKSGPNTMYYFEDTLYKHVLKRITLEKQLRRAVVLNEFVLHYQPKINVKTMKVDGCEALIRWNHPEGMLIYPNDFIPLAEEVGFIEEIGEWVVNEATRQVKSWTDRGFRIRVSLNVSGREFDDAYIQRLDKIIKIVGVDPCLLEVEITETAALKDMEHSRILVRTLHELGLGVSLDDFGTGYSSMAYIKELKASKLKIDKSFIDDLENYEQKIVVDSMIQLGKKLSYRINVEGVETVNQLRVLQSLGADEVQGWLFSKAIPPDEFLEFVINYDGNNAFL